MTGVSLRLFALVLISLAPICSAQKPSELPQAQSSAKPEGTGPSATRVAMPCALPRFSARQIQEVIDVVGSLPAPIAADAMIRIAEKISARCPARATDLLQRAFELAGAVADETALKLGSGASLQTDSRLAFAANAYALQQDRLSLRSRAVLAMAALSPSTAIEMFQRIPPPRLTPNTCQEALVPDVAVYYQAVEKVFALEKARKPRNETEARAPFLQLQEIFGTVTSPVQFPALAKILESANLSDAEFSLLLGSLSAAVANFPVDDNSFGSRGQYPAVAARVLIERLAAAKQISSYGFTHAVHDYLQQSLAGVHCEDNEPEDITPIESGDDAGALKITVRKFDVKTLNLLYQSLNRKPRVTDAGVEPLSLLTTLPPVEPGPDPGNYWTSTKAQELLIDAKHLNFDDQWKEYTDADRNTPEWRDRVERLLNHMEQWSASDEPDPADYLHERSILLVYRTLSYLPPGPLYDRILSMWLNTVAESSLQFEKPTEWYLEVRHFLDYSGKDRKAPTPDAAIAALRNSTNASLHACGVLADFLKQ